MAGKINIPQGAIFSADPEQQIYARGTLDRDMSGLSYMFKNAADTRAQGNQERYMQGVSEANRIAAALAQDEMMSEQAMETIKQAVKLAEIGVPASAMPALGNVIPNNDGSNDEAMTLIRLLNKAKIASANASASGGGGAAPGSKNKVEAVLDATGTPHFKYTAYGPDADANARGWVKGIKDNINAGGEYAPIGQKNPKDKNDPKGKALPPPLPNPVMDKMLWDRFNTGN